MALRRALEREIPRAACGFLIRDRRGRTLGWYLYFLKPGGISQVLQIAAGERDVAPVLDHLLEHAHRNGSAALQGRVEPGLIEVLSQRGCVWHATGYRLLVHTGDQGIVHAIDSGSALLSRLDGDWWTGMHLESFSSDSDREGAESGSGESDVQHPR